MMSHTRTSLPLLEDVHAVEALGKQLFRDDDPWIACLLRAAADLAASAGHDGLGRLLHALRVAHEEGSLADLLRRKRPHMTAARQATSFLEERGVVDPSPDSKATAVLRLLARRLSEPSDRLEAAVLAAMRALKASMALVDAAVDHKRRTQSAELTGATDLLRVLNGVHSAHGKSELSALLEQKRNTTIVGHVDIYLGGGSVAFGGPRLSWARRIARAFEGEPDEQDVEERARAVVLWLANSDAHLSVGTPLRPCTCGDRRCKAAADWPERIVAECVRLRATKASIDRRPYHYARAVLRGWGLTAAEADDVVSPAEREELG